MKFTPGKRIFHFKHQRWGTVTKSYENSNDQMQGYASVKFDGDTAEEMVLLENLKIVPEEGPDYYSITSRILGDIRCAMGTDKGENDLDAEIFNLSRRKALNHYLTWNGIHGYTEDILLIVDAFSKK